MNGCTTGRISSFQTLGTLDGPGVRFVVFMQGCPLRCACCHNPETWDISGGKEYTAQEVVSRAERCKEYFGENGGVTLSGGEPLMQAEFASELFYLCRKRGIGTCLDTSGCISNGRTERLLELTDYCLLDIKYTDDAQYRKYAGCGISAPLEFLGMLEKKHIPTRIRQVIIGGLNDGEDNLKRLAEIAGRYSCVERAELLAFRKLCTSKYKKLGIEFPLENTAETPQKTLDKLQRTLDMYIKKL